jgi:hypothetical protein
MKTFLAQSKKNSGLARKGGFVALFAVLISAVVLAITLGISNVAYKEVFYPLDYERVANEGSYFALSIRASLALRRAAVFFLMRPRFIALSIAW